MEVVLTASPEEAARLLADAIEALVGRRPDAVVRIAGVDYARIYRLR